MPHELIRETRDVILFATRRQDAPSQRRILRSLPVLLVKRWMLGMKRPLLRKDK